MTADIDTIMMEVERPHLIIHTFGCPCQIRLKMPLLQEGGSPAEELRKQCLGSSGRFALLPETSEDLQQMVTKEIHNVG